MGGNNRASNYKKSRKIFKYFFNIYREMESKCIIVRDEKTGNRKLIKFLRNEFVSYNEKIKIPDVEEIGERAFFRYRGEEVELSKEVKVIGDEAFLNSRIVRITIPKKINYIGNRCFKDCPLLKSVIFEAGDEIKESNTDRDKEINRLICKYYGIIRYKNIKDKLITGVSVFENCNRINNLVINNRNLNLINEYVFYNCKKIKKLNFLKDIKYILHSGFSNNKISKVEFSDEIEYIGESAFENSNVQLLRLGNNIKEIGEYSFSDCKLREVRFSKELKKIYENSFYQCKYLKKLYIDEGNETFYIKDMNSIYKKNDDGCGDEIFNVRGNFKNGVRGRFSHGYKGIS